MAAGEFNDLRHFGFRHFEGEHAADTHTVTVDMEHDLHGIVAILVEEPLQHMNDEFHRRVVVVQDEDLVEARLLGFRPRLGDDARSHAGALPALASV